MEQNQEQKKQSLIGAYNTARMSAGLGKLAVQLAARTVAIAASPVGWIAIGIGVVVVATFLIVFSAYAPSFPAEEAASLSPTPTLEPQPTESP